VILVALPVHVCGLSGSTLASALGDLLAVAAVLRLAAGIYLLAALAAPLLATDAVEPAVDAR
jgi:hypothetical protein